MASPSVPYAILPSIQETNDEDNYTTTVHRSILSLLDINKRYEWKNMFKGHAGAWCVGSSRDWLVLLDTNGCPLLLNPSSGATSIHFPPFPCAFIHRAGVPCFSYYVQYLRETFVSKAVLMGCSNTSPLQHTLVIMYSYPCKIAFFRHATTWVELFDAKRYYCDIVFNNNNLYALSGYGYVEGWDFRPKVPRKILDVKPTFEIDEEEDKEFPRDLFSTQFYLVISEGEFLLVKRYIGNFVNADGEVVYEGESLSSEGEICPYKTKHFVVYKLDFIKNRWEKLKTLHGRILFLGANESMALHSRASLGCEANSIYFTDDRWQEMNLDYSYGGHDWGVFSLQDSTIKLLAPYRNKMNPPPIWVVPTCNEL